MQIPILLAKSAVEARVLKKSILVIGISLLCAFAVSFVFVKQHKISSPSQNDRMLFTYLNSVYEVTDKNEIRCIYTATANGTVSLFINNHSLYHMVRGEDGWSIRVSGLNGENMRTLYKDSNHDRSLFTENVVFAEGKMYFPITKVNDGCFLFSLNTATGRGKLLNSVNLVSPLHFAIDDRTLYYRTRESSEVLSADLENLDRTTVYHDTSAHIFGIFTTDDGTLWYSRPANEHFEGGKSILCSLSGDEVTEYETDMFPYGSCGGIYVRDGWFYWFEDEPANSSSSDALYRKKGVDGAPQKLCDIADYDQNFPPQLVVLANGVVICGQVLSHDSFDMIYVPL